MVQRCGRPFVQIPQRVSEQARRAIRSGQGYSEVNPDPYVARLCKRIISMAYGGPVSPLVIDHTTVRSRKSRGLGLGLPSTVKGADSSSGQGRIADTIAICVNRQS